MSNNQQLHIDNMVNRHFGDIGGNISKVRDNGELADWIKEFFGENHEVLGVGKYWGEWAVIMKWNTGAHGQEAIIKKINFSKKKIINGEEKIKMNEISGVIWHNESNDGNGLNDKSN